jgi:nucleoside-diphosphate-sugar epimerase
VGTEVCLLLAHRGVSVVPICRSKPGSALLRRWGLQCRHGSLASPEAARELLAGCDTVVDFSLPGGYPSDLRPLLRELIGNSFRYSEPDARHVYASTIAAFGTGARDGRFRDHWIAHTTYGWSKRYAEKVVRQAAARTEKQAYILRLGEVNGELQRHARRRVQALASLRPARVAIPSGLSFAVFTYSVAEAIQSISEGRQSPGLYTLVSNPRLSWRSLLQYYLDQLDFEPEIIIEERGGSGSAKGTVFRALERIAESYRNEISSYLTARFPSVDRLLRFERSRHKAAAQASQIPTGVYRPFLTCHTGEAPGRRLPGLTTDLNAVLGELGRFRAWLRERQPEILSY